MECSWHILYKPHGCGENQGTWGTMLEVFYFLWKHVASQNNNDNDDNDNDKQFIFRHVCPYNIKWDIHYGATVLKYID